MKNESIEKKYLSDLPQKEIQELNETVKSASAKIIADNIARMKKTDPNRPAAMQYFDEISDFFGQRQKEIPRRKSQGQKSRWVLLRFCTC